MAITRVPREEATALHRRSFTKVNEYIYREFEAIRKHLKDKPPTAREALRLDFKDLPEGKPNQRNAINKLRRLLRNYIAENDLGLSIVGGKEAKQNVLLIVTSDGKPSGKRTRAA